MRAFGAVAERLACLQRRDESCGSVREQMRYWVVADPCDEDGLGRCNGFGRAILSVVKPERVNGLRRGKQA